MNILLIIIISILINKSQTYSVTECDDTQFKCYNTGICIQINYNSTTTHRICSCKPNYTGKQCEQLIMPCDSNPCAPNGYCNSFINDDYGYFCRCKPGFQGDKCQENINECLNATCYNGGLCIDGINSYECECKWPNIGRYCQLKQTCETDNICKNNGICTNDANSIHCQCPNGFEGVDCSIKTDLCLSQPCLFGGECVQTNTDYKCNCVDNRSGENCQFENLCAKRNNPCKNNSTCVNLSDSNSYYCKCSDRFSGINCDIINQCSGSNCRNDVIITTKINTNNEKFNTKLNNLLNLLKTTTTSITTTSSPIQTTTEETSQNNTNGSFVLIVNIEPSEFQIRKAEIIKEFEKKFGILMLIKKDAQNNEMVYPFNQNKKQQWTKIYFIIIFACLFKSPNSNTNSICLQNNIDDLNDNNQVLNELKKSSSLLPNYVSNISYEAYNNDQKRPTLEQSGSNLSASLIICLAVVLIIGITLTLTVLLRQNGLKRVKAPIWTPPEDKPIKTTYDYTSNEPIYEKVIKTNQSNNKWSINKVFDDFTHVFSSNKIGEISPSSSTGRDSNEYIEDMNPPLKMRKLDLSGQQANQPSTPEYYPSPPESIPDASFHHILNPINYKGSNSLTTLMLFIMGKSKNKHQNSYMKDSDAIDKFVKLGCDINCKNTDGETALHLAARCGLTDIVKALVLNSADLTQFDNSGRNVLHTAVSSNQLEIVQFILSHCSASYNESNDLILDEKFDLIDSKTNDDLGDTALIIASRLNFNDIIHVLIEYNASINATDNDGRSALHWCSKVNNLNGALKLIKAGANVNMQDNDEKTPLSSALNELFTKDIADLLIKCDAFVSADDEIKYNKMKLIVENFISYKSNTNYNVNEIKNDLINKIKQEPSFMNKKCNISKENAMQRVKETNRSTRLIGTSTKRKLSDTNQSDNNKKQNKTSKVNEQVQQAYIPLTPSPPINYNRNQQQFQMYPNQTNYFYNQQLQQQDSYSASYNLNDYQTNGNVNLGYLNDNKSYYDFNQQTNATSTNSNYNLFNSNFNESYTAYF